MSNSYGWSTGLANLCTNLLCLMIVTPFLPTVMIQTPKSLPASSCLCQNEMGFGHPPQTMEKNFPVWRPERCILGACVIFRETCVDQDDREWGRCEKTLNNGPACVC